MCFFFVAILPPPSHQAKTMFQVLKSTNFDLESPLKVAHMVDLGMPDVSPSAGRIHMMLVEATHKCCVVDEVEVSNP